MVCNCGNGVVDADEACDGDDLSGQDCVDLGFSGGTLMCDANCLLDPSACVNETPTTGNDTPTTAATNGPATESDAGSDESSAGEGGAQDGCSCQGGQRSSAWWALLLLGGVGLARRRSLVAVGLSVILAGLAGCRPAVMGDETTGTEDTTASSGTTGDSEISRRMFGVFHHESTEVGYINPDANTFAPHSNVQIESDGILLVHRSLCDEEPTVQEFTWVPSGADTLQVVPKEYAPDGSFEFQAGRVTSVQIQAGPGCDDVLITTEHPPDTGQATSTNRYVPGAVCAKALSESCHYELVWCDDIAPPNCAKE